MHIEDIFTGCLLPCFFFDAFGGGGGGRKSGFSRQTTQTHKASIVTILKFSVCRLEQM